MIEILNDNLDCIEDYNCYILFYFTASWCGPCQRIKPIIKEISDGVEESKLRVCMIDIDDNSELVEKYNINSVPTMILLLDNEQIAICNGTNKEKLVEFFKKIV
jgi:thioredoxin 1